MKLPSFDALRMFGPGDRATIAAIRRSQAVIEFTPDGIILDANPIFLAAMGYALEEIRGKHHRMFLEPAAAEGQDYHALWQGLRDGQHQAGTFHRLAKGGRDVWIQATYFPVLNRAGKPVRVLKFAADITAQKRDATEKSAIIAAIERSQATVELALDGTILAANANFLQALGYQGAEVAGQHHRIFLDPAEAAQPPYAQFWAALRRGEFQAGEYHRIGKGGRDVWLEASYNPIRDPSGKPWKVIGFATDVTPKVLERQRRAQLGGELAGQLAEVSGKVLETARFAGAAKEAGSATSANVQAVAAGAEQLASSVGEISRQVQHASRAASAGADEARRATEIVQTLVAAAEKITQVVGMITNIAGQTNLLALNATIEAARAGEAGKGFAVVASEVKGLAGQTAKATQDIADQISEVQTAVRSAVEAIRSITAAIANIDSVTGAIAAAVEEQGAVTRDMSVNMQSAARAVDHLSGEITSIAAAALEAEAFTGRSAETSRALVA